MRILYARPPVPLIASMGSAWKYELDSELVVQNMKPSFFPDKLLLGFMVLVFVGSLLFVPG